MTYGPYTQADVYGYANAYLQQHHYLAGCPVWRYENATIQQGGLSFTAPNSPQFQMGASITFKNKPPHNTVITLQDQTGSISGIGVDVELSDVYTDTTVTATITPHASPAGKQSRITVTKVWSDGVTSQVVHQNIYSGGPPITITSPLTRPGSTATFLGFDVSGPTPPNDFYDHLFGFPFELGFPNIAEDHKFNVKFDNLRLDGNHMICDYAITNGALEPFGTIMIQMAHHTPTYDSQAMNTGRIIRSTAPASGTFPLTDLAYSPADYLYQGDTNPLNYHFGVQRYSAEGDPLSDVSYVGHLPAGENFYQGSPFTRSESGDIINTTTLPHTILFNWSQGNVAS